MPEWAGSFHLVLSRIIECFERASSPSVSDSERRRLLTFLVVGGGPTSIEFASELHDFLQTDVSRWYSDLATFHSVILVEPGKHLLGSFDERLSGYVERLFKKRKITTLTGESVSHVRGNRVELSSGRVLGFGVCVWSTGNAPLDFVSGLGLELSRQGRILTDPCLRVADRPGVFALGDCAEDRERPLGQLAQVANQQGRHLARSLNRGQEEPFHYRSLGAMAQLGTWDAVVDTGHGPTVSVGAMGTYSQPVSTGPGSLPCLAVRLLGQAGVRHQQDPHPDVLVQVLLVRERHLQVLGQLHISLLHTCDLCH
jgi:NADH dehydrogenase FAD-containing subunit